MKATTENLKDASSHFAFGENWSDYAAHINDERIAEAEKGLLRLVTQEELTGKHLLDIGCGSGLHALAALRLGAAAVTAIDVDPISVATTKKVLEQYVPNASFTVATKSVFDLDPTEQYDIVYSWGVLHHTGAMYEAIKCAAAVVKPNGLFVFALYRKMYSCGVWKIIKRWYTNASPRAQARARATFLRLKRWRFAMLGHDFDAYVNGYARSRGMSYEHDVHDWIGGYPYESITPAHVDDTLTQLAFAPVRRCIQPTGIGFFGSGCDEYVFTKLPPQS